MMLSERWRMSAGILVLLPAAAWLVVVLVSSAPSAKHWISTS